MRVQRSGLILFTFATLGISGVAIAPAVADETRGTMEQQMACTPDVMRLCSDLIPDAGRIAGCLRQNTPQLSGACRAVFETNNSMPQRDTRRARMVQPRQAPPAGYAERPRSYQVNDD
jgi:hypothetical protein